MRKRPWLHVSLAISLLALSAGHAGAAGIDLGWDDCPGGAAYSVIKTFACDTNVGFNTMVGSFVAPAGVVAMSANEIVIDMITGGPALSPWWAMATGQCRPSSSLLGDFDFTLGPFTCYDYWQAGAIGALAWSVLPYTTNRCRIKGVFALPAGDARITSIPEGTHVYSFKGRINNAKSTGLGACAGCSDEACIVLQNIRLNQPVSAGGHSIYMTNPATVQHVIWQAWSTGDPVYQCPLITPAKTRSWGSIKALYR
jgi:hypothetical protein